MTRAGRLLRANQKAQNRPITHTPTSVKLEAEKVLEQARRIGNTQVIALLEDIIKQEENKAKQA